MLGHLFTSLLISALSIDANMADLSFTKRQGFITPAVEYCKHNVTKCVGDNKEKAIHFDENVYADLLKVNLDVNYRKGGRVIKRDESVWNSGKNSLKGESDYVFIKRDSLLEMGCPLEALNVALTVQETTERVHLVLLVKTDVGFLVMDDLTDYISSYDDYTYLFLWVSSYRNLSLFREVHILEGKFGG